MSDINHEDQIQDDVVRPEPGPSTVVVPPQTAPAPPAVVSPPETAPELVKRQLPPTRIGAAWVGLCALALVAIAFIVFILQNTRRVQVTFLGFHASLPLAVALLIAAVAGVLVVLCVGTIRITQLRRMARRTNDGRHNQRG